MAEGEEVEIEAKATRSIAAAGDPSGTPSRPADKVRTIVLAEDLPPDKWALRRAWMRLAWMAFVVAFIFVWVWAGYEMQWGAEAVVAVALLEVPFFMIAFAAYLTVMRKRKRTRVVRARRVSA